jgi:hypothetical protein
MPGFTSDERGSSRKWLLEHAQADSDIVAAAVTGSSAAETEDEWSDIDLGFAVADGVEVGPVIERWTGDLEQQLGLVHYWDLAAGEAAFRVFLLPNGLEVDLAFTPAESFGPRGPDFWLVFGEHADTAPVAADRRYLIGLGWHYVLHATACIARGKPWQAEWLISGARDHALALACARLDLPTAFARGADGLPVDERSSYEQALVRSLETDELRRSLDVVQRLFLDEVRAVDPGLADGIEAALAL